LWAKDALSAYGGDRGVFHGPTHGAYGVECYLNTARNYIWKEYTETKCVRESDSDINGDLKTFTESVATVEDCQALCEASDDCNAYFYYSFGLNCHYLQVDSTSEYTTITDTDSSCYLKDTGANDDEVINLVLNNDSYCTSSKSLILGTLEECAAALKADA
jgi:hypothetical protein